MVIVHPDPEQLFNGLVVVAAGTGKMAELFREIKKVSNFSSIIHFLWSGLLSVSVVQTDDEEG